MEANPGSLIESGRQRCRDKTVVLTMVYSPSFSLTACAPMGTDQAEENVVTDQFFADPRVSEADGTAHTQLPWIPGNASRLITGADKDVELAVCVVELEAVPTAGEALLHITTDEMEYLTTPQVDTGTYPVKAMMERSQRFAAFANTWSRP